MNYTVKFPGSNYVINTKCAFTECSTGGLSRHYSKNEYEIECTNKNIERWKDSWSFLLTSKSCFDFVSKYKQKDPSLEKFLSNVGVNVKNLDDLFRPLIKWLFLSEKMINKQGVDHFLKTTQIYISIADLYKDLEHCENKIKDELEGRKLHLKKCVCLSDKGHTDRVIYLRDACLSIQKFKQFLGSYYCKQDDISMLNQTLEELYFIFKYTNEGDKHMIKFEDELKKLFNIINKSSLVWKSISIDDNGDIESDIIIDDLLVFSKILLEKQLVTDRYYVEHYIQSKIKHAIESVYYDDNVFNQNLPNYVTCVDVSNQNEIVVGLNYTQLSKHLATKDFNISPKFLEQFIETHNKELIYKSCFFGMLKYNSILLEKVCKQLASLKIDEDIKKLLSAICSVGGSGGLKWIYTPDMERKLKTLIPNLQGIYNNKFNELEKHTIFGSSTYKGTGDLLQDLKYLKESFLIDLIVEYEHEWKDFSRKFKDGTSTKKRLKR